MGYTITFKSLMGKTCTIDIDGGGTALTGAADPFKWDETDSDDLLEVVRHRSGYINVVEEDYGDLDALHPDHSTDIPVTMSYDGKVVFTGFIQAQDFEAPYAPGPRVLNIPVQSPMGVAGERRLSPRVVGGDYEGVSELSTSGSDLQYYLGSDGKWATATASDYGRFIAITPGKRYIVVTRYMARAAVVRSTTCIGGASADFATGCTTQEISGTSTYDNFNNAYIFTAPSNATHIYISMKKNGTSCLASIIQHPDSIDGIETLGSVMKEVCTALNIEYVVMPKGLLASDVHPMHVSVNKRLLSPYNDDYKFGTNDLFEPITYEEFVEGVCNLYGLIAHDSVDADGKAVLVLSKMGYTGAWLKMAVSTLDDTSVTGTEISQPSATFFNNYAMADDNGRVSHVRPLGRLDIDYGDMMETVDMNLCLSSNPAGRKSSLAGADGSVVYLLPLSLANGGEFLSRYLNTNDISYHQSYTTNQIRTAGNGGEMIDIMYYGPTDPISYQPLFEYVFTDFPRSKFDLLMKTSTHSYVYRVEIESGGKFVAKGGVTYWSSVKTIMLFTKNNKNEYVVSDIPGATEPVIVRIYPDLADSNALNLFGDPVTELSLTAKEAAPCNKYLLNLDSTTRVIKQSGEYEDASINCLFHDYVDNPGRIIGGHLAAVDGYDYMFKSKTLLKVSTRRTNTASLDLSRAYLQNVTIDSASGWRVLAVGFNPWDDEFDFTFIKA